MEGLGTYPQRFLSPVAPGAQPVVDLEVHRYSGGSAEFYNETERAEEFLREIAPTDDYDFSTYRQDKPLEAMGGDVEEIIEQAIQQGLVVLEKDRR